MNKATFGLMAVMAIALLTMSGCATKATAIAKKIVHPDGTTEYYSETSIMSTGDKASEVAADGMFADGTEEDLGSGFKKASGKQESTGIEGTLKGMGDFMTGFARALEAAKGVPSGSSASQPVIQGAPAEAVDGSAPVGKAYNLSPATTTAAIPDYAAMSTKIAEAKLSGKPLVVIAGSPTCGYCSTLKDLLDADTAFTGRDDIVLYRETNAWTINAALSFTGGGPAPIVRVVKYDVKTGKAVCDTTLNRPKTVAEIADAINTCSPPK